MDKAFASLLLFVLLGSAAAATDPFVGKWKLNVRQSHYPAGTCPKQMTIEMAAKVTGVEYRSDTIFADGRMAHSSYIADYSGKQSIVLGNRGMMLPVSLKRLSPRVVVASYFRGFEVVATSRRAVSSDGRQMTITTKSKDANGKTLTTVGSYEKF